MRYLRLISHRVAAFSACIALGCQVPNAPESSDLGGDLNLLAEQNCEPITLTDPTEDLGRQLTVLIDSRRCVSVILSEKTWTWNDRVTLRPQQVLRIRGTGSDGFGKNPKVTINMTKNATSSNDGPRRDPGRLLAKTGASFTLSGVRVVESANDARKLSWFASSGALFVAMGTYVTLTLEDLRVVTSEDVVSAGDRSFVNVRLGHTSVDKGSGAPRDILAVKLYSGADFGGSFLFVHNGYVDLGPGVGFMADPAIFYNSKSYQDGAL